jgi:two-component system chemotaxis response regulator CheB
MRVQKDAGGFQIEILPKETGTHYNPSADLLFESLADSADQRTIGTVLTGMGDDGCKGLKRLKEKGGITIAESQKTAVIFGMPQEAIHAGVIDHILPLPEIPIALKLFCRIL